jgi:capping protein beta
MKVPPLIIYLLFGSVFQADSPTEKDPLEASLFLLRQLPPHSTEANLERLVKLRPELEAELRNAVDVPAKVVQGEFLACDYNREGDLYR